jgi:hypothetical protein
MESYKRFHVDIMNGEKFDENNPRSVVAFLQGSVSLIISSAADPYVNVVGFKNDTVEIKNKLDELQRQHDDYDSFKKFNEEQCRSNLPVYFIPESIKTPTKESVEILRFTQQRLVASEKVKALAATSCGLVLKMIKSSLPQIVDAGLYDVFHSLNLENHIQVRRCIQFVADNFLGDSIDVRRIFDSLIRNHLPANNLRELKMMLDNIVIIHSEMTSHYDIAVKSRDLIEMHRTNSLVDLFNKCPVPISQSDLADIILSKISKSPTSDLMLFLAKLNQLPTKFPTFIQISMLIKEFTKDLPLIVSLRTILSPVINNIVLQSSSRNECFSWDGHKCSFPGKCIYVHTPGRDTRQQRFSRNKSPSKERNLYNNRNARNRSRDNYHDGRSYYQNNESSGENRYGDNNNSFRSRDNSPSTKNNDYHNRSGSNTLRSRDNSPSRQTNDSTKYAVNLVQNSQSEVETVPIQMYQSPNQQYTLAPGTPHRG